MNKNKKKKEPKIEMVIKGVEFKNNMVIMKEYQKPTEQEQKEMRVWMAKFEDYFPRKK